MSELRLNQGSNIVILLPPFKNFVFSNNSLKYWIWLCLSLSSSIFRTVWMRTFTVVKIYLNIVFVFKIIFLFYLSTFLATQPSIHPIHLVIEPNQPAKPASQPASQPAIQETLGQSVSTLNPLYFSSPNSNFTALESLLF